MLPYTPAGVTGSDDDSDTKLTLEKKIFPPLLPGFELVTFVSRVRCCHQQAIQAVYMRAKRLLKNKTVVF